MQWERTRDMGRINPGEITNDDILDDKDGYYIDPKGILQFPLRPGLIIDKDVKVLLGECAVFLYEIYGGIQIIRRKPSDATNPDLYPPMLNVVVLPDLQQFIFAEKLQSKKLLLDQTSTIQQVKKDLADSILPHYGYNLSLDKIRIWKLANDLSLTSLRAELLNLDITPLKYKRNHNGLLQEYNCGVEFPGPSADFYPEAPVVKFFNDSPYLIIETATHDGKFIFRYRRNVRPGVCPACNLHKFLVCSCSCELVSYCSEQCRDSDKAFHSQICPHVGIGEVKIAKKMDAKNGVVGLANMGNTCYLNSALQCLSNTYELTKYFLNNGYEKDINTTNKLGCKGEFAYAYAKFLFAVWNNNESVITPHYLSKVITKYHPIVTLLITLVLRLYATRFPGNIKFNVGRFT